MTDRVDASERAEPGAHGDRPKTGGAGHRIVTALTRALNPPLLQLARSGVIPLWAVMRHRGRRSGRLYETPIAIRPTADGFIIPLPFTERADWCRNVLAAGGAVIRWKGVDQAVVDPEVIDAATALPAFAPVLRLGARALGIKRYLRVRRA